MIEDMITLFIMFLIVVLVAFAKDIDDDNFPGGMA